MRLINVHSLDMKEFLEHEIPPYVILSHRWETDEISFQDFKRNKGRNKASYHKIERLREIASLDVNWIWLDTCCIDKRNLTELSEAINSMYKWYKRSEYCVAYLFDAYSQDTLASSSWFERCWTLQELIAPVDVRFYGKNWLELGRKSDMVQLLSSITGIDEHVLAGTDPTQRSVAQRMSWAAHRKATRIEDEAYSLLGLFDLSMPMLYGDGKRAFQTLQERIIQTSDDESLFAWNLDPRASRESPVRSDQKLHGLLAPGPANFATCQDITTAARVTGTGFALTSTGVQLSLLVRPYKMRSYQVALNCSTGHQRWRSRVVIFLQELEEDGEFARIELRVSSHATSDAARFKKDGPVAVHKTMHVRHHVKQQPVNAFYGFRIPSLHFMDCPPHEMAKTVILLRDSSTTLNLSESMLVPMPSGGHGTVATIIPPMSAAHRSWLPLTCLYLGFDSEFNPFCVLEHSRSNARKLNDIRFLHNSPLKPNTGLIFWLSEKLRLFNHHVRHVDNMAMKRDSDVSATYECRGQSYAWDVRSVFTIPYWSIFGRNVEGVPGHGVVRVQGKSANVSLRSDREFTFVKTSKDRSSLVYLDDHGIAVSFHATYMDSDVHEDYSMIWNVRIIAYSRMNLIHVASFILDYLPWSYMSSNGASESIKKDLRDLEEQIWWLWSWPAWIFFYRPVQMLMRVSSLVKSLGWAVVYLFLLSSLGVLWYTFYRVMTISTQPLTPDMMRGVLNGTYSGISN